MKAVIVAAGKGTRLKEFTTYQNKCSIKIGEKSIIKRIVDNFKTNNIHDNYIVTGHCADNIKSEIKDDAIFLHNPMYHSAGILLSLWFAREKVCGKDFIFSTGDNIFDQKILSEFLSTEGDVIAIKKKDKCTPYDMKVIVENDKIMKIEEDIPCDLAMGEFAMLIKFNSDTSQKFFNTIQTFLEEKEKIHCKLVDVLNLMIEEGCNFKPYYIESHQGIEIDTFEDLKEAREIIKNFD